jgi:tryptophanyl-tRNA synthetase
VEDLKTRYREGRVGDVEVKRKLIRALEGFLGPIRERRAELASRRGLVEEILHAGNQAARDRARETIGLAREAMGLTYYRD